MPEEVLIEAENLGKKFCRSLKRSLWYGVQDILGDLNPLARRASTDASTPELREHEFWALQDVSFQLRRGECLGLIGHNGAGKSTLLKILNGLIRPDTGRLVTRGRVGALIELSAGFNPILTGRENIYNRGAVLGFSREEIAKKFDAIVEFAEIGDFIDMPVRNYSSGMAVRLGFAVSSQMEPDILILDEVLAVGDAQFRHKCLGRMHEIKERTAIIFVSHSMPQIYRVSTNIVHLHAGSIAYSDTNVGDGITSYLQTIKALQPNTVGAKEIELVNFRVFRNESIMSQAQEFVVEHGDSLRFCFDARINSEIGEVAVKLSLWNSEMIPACDIVDSELRNFSITQSESGTFSIEVHIPSITLSTGRYNITAVFSDKEFSKIHSRHENIMQIVVKSQYPTGAISILPANWSSTAQHHA